MNSVSESKTVKNFSNTFNIIIKNLSCRFRFLLLLLFSSSVSESSFSQDFLPKINQLNSLQKDSNNFYFNQIWIKSKDVNFDDLEGYLRRASDKIELGYYKEALIDVNKTISLDSTLSHSYSLKGFIMLKCDSLNLALSSFNKAIALNDTNIYNYLYLAEIYMFMKKFHEADSLYNKVICKNGKMVNGYFGLGNLYYRQGQYELAESQYKKVLELDPDFSQAYFNMAIMYIFKDPNKAMKNLNKTIEISPKFAVAYYIMGYLEMRQNHINSTLKHWTKAIELDSLNNLYRISLGFMKINDKNYAGGFKEISKVLVDKRRKNLVSDFEKSYKDKITSDFLIQVLTFNDYHDRFPDDEKDELIKAMCLFYSGKHDLAENIYKKQVNASSCPGLVHFLRGYNFENSNKPDQSLTSYKESLNHIPFPDEVYLRLGIIDNIKGQYYEAIQRLNRYKESNDSSLAVYLSLANAYINISKYDSAIFNLNKLLELDSMQLDIYFNRAFCFTKLEQYSYAINDYQYITRHRIFDIESYCLMAENKYLSGDTTGAYNLLNQTYQKFHGLPENGYYVRGTINLYKMNYDSAIADFSWALRFKDHHDDLMTLRGLAYYCLADYERAKEDLTMAVDINENDPAAVYTLGLVNIKLNNPGDAYNNLKRAEYLGHPLAGKTISVYLRNFKPPDKKSP